MDSFAGLLAEGLADPDARAALHEALRLSPLTVHTVPLADFVASEGGARVLKATAARTGVPLDEIRAFVGTLPPMDVFVGYREHRRTWLASQPISVAPIVDDESPWSAYLAGGQRIPLNRASSIPATATAVLVLAPREHLLRRPDAGVPQLRGDVIEVDTPMEYECEEPTLRSAFDLTPDVSRVECSGGGGGEGGGGGGTPTNLIIETFTNNGVCDHFCGDPAEFEFKGWDANDVYYPNLVRCENVNEFATITVSAWCGNNIVHDHSPESETNFVRVLVQETDAGDDDQFRDCLTPEPGFICSLIFVVDNASNTKFSSLHEVPEDFGCPSCPARLSVTLKWW